MNTLSIVEGKLITEVFTSYDKKDSPVNFDLRYENISGEYKEITIIARGALARACSKHLGEGDTVRISGIYREDKFTMDANKIDILKGVRNESKF